MSGRAIIILVTGVIIITGTIMHNIQAASTRIVKNYTDYYMRQNNQNYAQSGVNLAMTELGKDRKWRTGFTGLSLSDGVVNVDLTDVLFDSIPVVRIRSVAETDYGIGPRRRDTSTAFVFRPKKQHPLGVTALLTLNASVNVAGGIVIDGRNHDLSGAIVPGSGIPAVWTTSGSFTQTSASTKLGGTDAGIDYAPANPYVPQVVKLNQTLPGGFPMTPDSVFGGAAESFPEGTLKAIAKSGYAGSQYVTDTKNLKFPLCGVTYVEMPTTSPKNEWGSADITGSGILIVHNAAGNAVMKGADGKFTGLVMADEILLLHGDILGGLITFSPTITDDMIGNGSANLLYSREALVEASRFLETHGKPSVVAWWE